MRFFLLIALLALLGRWAMAAPIIHPSTSTVYIGGAVQVTSTDTITCALAAGSLGTISGCLYTAPSTYFVPHNMQSGCQLMPEDHIFNTDISNLPVDSHSAGRMTNLTTVLGTTISLGWDIDMPWNSYSAATPTQSLSCRFTHGNDGLYPMWPFPTRGEEASNMSNEYFVQDHHIMGVSTDTCKFYEQYQYYPAGEDGAHPLNTDDSCVQYDGMTYNLPDTTGGGGGGVDAAGMPVQPLLIKYSELNAGVINHALRFTLDNGNIHSSFLWPAVASTNECSTVNTCFPYGSRLRLKSTFAIKSTLSPQAKAIYTALKKYGMILADGGTAGHVTMFQDATMSTNTWNAVWSELATSSISIQTDMDQVDESSLMVSTASGKVNLSNAFVTPANFAEVVATKVSDSSTATLRIAIQVPTAGMINPSFQANPETISVMAGTPQFQIPAYVNGSTDTTVTCSMNQAVGTLTSDCKYTAPTLQTNQVLVTTVTITPRISATGKYQFPLIVFSSDAIRMRDGPLSGFGSQPPFTSDGDYVDTFGYKWFMDPVGNLPNFYTRDTQGSANWTGTDPGLYYAFDYASGDKVWSAMVPNGTYQLRSSHGVGSGNAADVNASTNSLESQGVIYQSSVPLVTATYTPGVFITSPTVTDNTFHWAIRGNDSHTHDFISDWSLTFLSSTVPAVPAGPRLWKGRIRVLGRPRVL